MTVMRTQLRGVARRPARLLLTGLAVLVASLVVFATVLSQQIAERTALSELSGVPEATSVVVTGEKPLTADALAKIKATPGVAEAVGRLTSYVARSENPQELGFAMIADPGSGPLARVKLVSGAYPDAPGEVAVSKRTAERMGLKEGARTSVVAEGGRPSPIVVTGVVDAAPDEGRHMYAPEVHVAKIANTPLDRVEVRADAGTSTQTLSAAIAAALNLPADSVQDAATVREQEAKGVVDDLDTIFAMLSMFVFIAVVAAGLVATSTFRIVFAQRMRQLALLRTVGASRGKLVRALAAEGVLTGVVAGAAGVAGAFALGQMVPLALRGFDIGVLAPGFPIGAAVAVVVGAALITLLAVLAPAVSASKVAPLEALRSSATTSSKVGIGWKRAVLGVLFALAAVALVGLVFVLTPGPDESNEDPTLRLFAIVLSGTSAFFALLAFGPVIVRPILRGLGWPLRLLGPVGRLAVGGVGGAPRRAAAVSAVVALGVTLITGLLVTSNSIRGYAEREIVSGMPADFEVLAGASKALPNGLADRLRKRTELAHVTPYRRLENVTAAKPGGSLQFGATDLDLRALPSMKKLQVATGSLNDLGPGRVVLSDLAARELQAKAGDTLKATAAGRTIEVKVAATLHGGVPLNGQLIAHSADFDKLGAPATATGLLADAATSGERARNTAQSVLRTEVGSTSGIEIDVLADRRDEFEKGFTAVVAIMIALLGLTVIIAVVGVGTTTALSVVERTRESGLLRAVGLSRTGLRTMLTTEASMYGVIGAAIGLALGVPYAALSVYALAMEVPLEIPVGQLAGVMVVIAGLTALAGVLPARKAAKVSPVAALGSDE